MLKITDKAAENIAKPQKKMPVPKSSNKNWPEVSPTIKDSKSGKTYERGILLGEGGFAKVYEVYDEQRERFACKVIHKSSISSDKHKQKLRTEIKINRTLKHQFIVKFYSCFEDTNFVYIILEVCENQSLMELLKKRKTLTEEETRFYMAQLLSAIEFCHKGKVIHRDLKLGNIFLNEKLHVKVGDFGLAAQLTTLEDRKKTICGTPNYIAPEVLFNGDAGHSFEADIWSLGVIMYTMIIGIPPFQTKDTNKIYQRIKIADFSFPPNKPISEEARHLITLMLNKNPEQRPSITKINDHPFFQKYTPITLPLSSLISRPDYAKIAEENRTKKSGSNTKVSPREFETLKPILMNKSPASENKHSYIESPNMANSNVNKGVFDVIIENIETLVNCKEKTLAIPNSFKDTKVEMPVFISKWIDHGEKYGLGYQLTNNSTGIFFKDSTTLVFASDEQNFDYLHYLPTVNNKVVINRKSYNLNNYPSELGKKIKLFQTYKSYMEENLSSSVSTTTSSPSTNLDYLTKFVRTKHAVLFRLSSRVIQVNFFDHFKLVISQEGQVLTVIDKSGQPSHHRLVDVINNSNGNTKVNADVYNRVIYVKDMLEHMIQKRKQV